MMKMGNLTRIMPFLACVPVVVMAEDKSVTVEQVLNQCYYKYAGDDQRSKMDITLKAPGGKPMKSTYRRLWKNYDGKDGVVDKVLLFTESPPHNRGLAFMRWGYTGKSQKATEQWIYLPDLRKVRRLSPRDPETKEWVIKDDDLRQRELHEDTHKYLGEKTEDGQTYYVVEFLPKDDPVYGKREFWFSKANDWNGCLQRKVDFFNKDGVLVKQQQIEWKQIGKAWTWKKVNIESTESDAFIHYDMKNVEVNVGLDDDVFSNNTMKRGYRR